MKETNDKYSKEKLNMGFLFLVNKFYISYNETKIKGGNIFMLWVILGGLIAVLLGALALLIGAVGVIAMVFKPLIMIIVVAIAALCVYRLAKKILNI